MPNNIAHHHIPTVAAVQQQQRSPMMGNGIMPNAAVQQQKPNSVSIGRKLPATPVDRSRASALATMAFQNFSERFTKPSTLSLRSATMALLF